MSDKIPEMITINLTKVHLVLAIIFGCITMVSPIVAAWFTLNEHSSTIKKHEYRLTDLEMKRLDQRDILLEIKFNLKNHIENSGQTYIEGNGHKK